MLKLFRLKKEIRLKKELYPFQKKALPFLVSHKKCLLALEQGTGKTIIIVELMNKLRPTHTLIICPASLKLNWAYELSEWSEGNHNPIITSYASVNKVKDLDRKWDLVICDESHYLKNPKALRTKRIRNLKADRIVCATGTPILNRPMELHTTLMLLDKNNWSGRFQFGLFYCNGYKSKWGWDFTGASNIEHLNGKLNSSIMLRRTRKEVLPDLPNKTRQIVLMDSNKILKNLNEKLDSILPKKFEDRVKALKNIASPAFSEISRIRRLLAEEKVKGVIEYLKAFEGEKCVVFGYHRTLLEGLHAAFSDSVLLYGGMSDKAKDVAVRTFQNDSGIKFFFGSIKAAGVGLTLTAAHNVVFAESSWTPGEISQAEDRCCRIGQKNGVLVIHLVVENSLDVLVAKKVIAKQQIIDLIVERKIDMDSKKIKVALELVRVRELVLDLSEEGKELPKSYSELSSNIENCIYDLIESSKFAEENFGKKVESKLKPTKKVLKSSVKSKSGAKGKKVSKNEVSKNEDSKNEDSKPKNPEVKPAAEVLDFKVFQSKFIELAETKSADVAFAIIDQAGYGNLSTVPEEERLGLFDLAVKELEAK